MTDAAVATGGRETPPKEKFVEGDSGPLGGGAGSCIGGGKFCGKCCSGVAELDTIGRIGCRDTGGCKHVAASGLGGAEFPITSCF